MHIMWFTERAYHHVPEDEVLKLRSFFGVPNKFFDPQKGAQLLNQYLDEKIYPDELGTFDGVMLNEHHGTPFCMGAVMDVEAAVLARCTQQSQNRAARQSAAGGRQPGAPGRGAGDDRHHLGRAAGARMGSRRGQ